MIQSFLNFLFPTRCMGCSKDTAPLCTRCLALTRKSLSSPLPYNTSLFDYRDPLIKRSIRAIKYYRRKDLLSPLVSHLAQEASKLHLPHDAILVPIPMPTLRKWMRGYNQAELIALELGHLLSLPVDTSLLVRVKTPTRQVSSKSKQERMRNQRGSFAVQRDTTDMSIVVIDDITTTGATLEEARKVLLESGARSVQALTLAH